MSSKRRDSGEGFDPKRPHFFKVIVEDTIRDKKLMLPEKFVGEHGGSLSSPVSINVPGGMTWKIQMSKARTNNIYLVNKTWQKFAQHYSLKHGHFLVFQYEGASRFSVVIFDLANGSEIEYPVSNRGITTTTTTTRRKFSSEYPFFQFVITKPHLTKCNMTVPKSFAGRYLKRSQKVKLQAGGQWWNVNAYKVTGRSEAVQLSGGLTVFVKENAIEAGDVCFFELVGSKDGDQTYRVTLDHKRN